MKPVPLLLLLSSALLSSHLRPAAGRPRSLPGWLDGSSRLQTQQMEDVLLRAATDSAAADQAGDNLLRLLQRRDPDLLHLLPTEADGEESEALRTAAQLLKRSEEPPLSIDLTFHLLRNMIQMAKMESQREQAQLNRKVLDEVGEVKLSENAAVSKTSEISSTRAPAFPLTFYAHMVPFYASRQ